MWKFEEILSELVCSFPSPLCRVLCRDLCKMKVAAMHPKHLIVKGRFWRSWILLCIHVRISKLLCLITLIKQKGAYFHIVHNIWSWYWATLSCVVSGFLSLKPEIQFSDFESWLFLCLRFPENDNNLWIPVFLKTGRWHSFILNVNVWLLGFAE